jgi:hypothetical protein
MYILTNFLINSLSPLYSIFKIIPIILIFALILFKNRVSRIFSLYAGINYFLSAFLQGIAITDEYGLGIVTGNFVLMIVVALSWILEAFINRNDFTPPEVTYLEILGRSLSILYYDSRVSWNTYPLLSQG